MKKAGGYTRVSTTEQVSGTSLDEQERQITGYCSMQNATAVDLFTDAGVSGGIPLHERPAGQRLIAAVDSGAIDSIIVTKLDRGFRSASDCLNNVEAWEKRGVHLHILNLGGSTINTATSTGKFFITVIAGAAELERALIRERCTEGRKARQAQGLRVGEIPYGYILADDEKHLVENPAEQKILAAVHSLRGEGESLRAIAEHLNRDGVPAKKGGTWSYGQVQSILRSRPSAMMR